MLLRVYDSSSNKKFLDRTGEIEDLKNKALAFHANERKLKKIKVNNEKTLNEI